MTIKTLVEILKPYSDSEAPVDISVYDSEARDVETHQFVVCLHIGSDGVIGSVTLEAD